MPAGAAQSCWVVAGAPLFDIVAEDVPDVSMKGKSAIASTAGIEKNGKAARKRLRIYALMIAKITPAAGTNRSADLFAGMEIPVEPAVPLIVSDPLA